MNRPSLLPGTARVRHLVERVHSLGPAPLLHLLREVADGADLLSAIERYAALDPDFIRSFGGDRFSRPIHIVPREDAA